MRTVLSPIGSVRHISSRSTFDIINMSVDGMRTIDEKAKRENGDVSITTVIKTKDFLG